MDTLCSSVVSKMEIKFKSIQLFTDCVCVCVFFLVPIFSISIEFCLFLQTNFNMDLIGNLSLFLVCSNAFFFHLLTEKHKFHFRENDYDTFI